MDTTIGVRRRDSDEDALVARKEGRVLSSLAPAHEEAFNERFLKYFYAKLFPYKAMFRWLSYGNDPDVPSCAKPDYFARREWSFTTGEDAYIRYLSFRDADEFAKGVMARQPYKIDIGAVFSHRPSEHERLKKGVLAPMERELVFDIDLTDYDDIRTCCSGAAICQKCWAYMNVAIGVLDQVLRTDFGFRQIMFVYSGRRGVHCWVCDESARLLTDEARSAVVNYISALHGDSTGAASAGSSPSAAMFARILSNLTIPMHPSFVRALAELESVFETAIIPAKGQGLLATQEQWNKVLDLIPSLPEGVSADMDVKNVISEAWAKSNNTPEKRWRQLKATVSAAVSEMGGSLAGPDGSILSASSGGTAKVSSAYPRDFRAGLEKLIPAIIFAFTYPRLDVNVSKQRHHLLKSPFCIHPKTGRVCVPIPINDVHSFDPAAVPTVAQLAKEGFEYERGRGSETDGPRTPAASDVWMHTSLRSHIEGFELFVQACTAAATRRRRDAEERDAAMTGDW